MQGFENYESMFAQSIGITEPWRIDRTEFDEEKQEVHVTVMFCKTAKYPCPECGALCERYDDEDKERTWRHGDVVFFPCFVHCRRPRVKCKKHGVHVVTAPWARPNSRYTLLFESYAMLLMKSMPVENARKLLRISHTSATGILRYWVFKAIKEDDLNNIKAICIDETSFKRGQSLDTMYSCKDYEDGKAVFNKLISWLRRSRLEPMKQVANTLKKHKQEILSYFFHRLTNAIAEGINSIIQSAKRRARGFRTIEGYVSAIFLAVGKLNLSCPALFE